MQVDLDPSVACWTNPSGTLKGVGPGTELDWYVQRLHAADPGVVKVDLCKQMLGPEGAREIMEALENSSTARSVLLGADEIGPEGARAVGQALHKNRSLRTVFLGCNAIGEQGAKYIAGAIEKNPIVEGYWLKRNQIGLTGLQAILSALRTNQTVKTLDLVQNDLGAEGALMLENAFTDYEHPLSVTNLYLSGNDFGVEGARHLAGIIRSNKTIKHLYLGLNNFGEEGSKIIADALKENNTILTLAVLSNQMGPIAAASFADALRHNTTLECLDLGYAKATKVLNGQPNAIGDNGAKALAAALEGNSSLQVLNLTKNGIGQAGMSALAAALSTNASLTSLVLQHNREPTVPVLEAFNQALLTNTTLVKLVLPCVKESSRSRFAGPTGALHEQRKTLLNRNKARAGRRDILSLPEEEQARLRELKDIKSDYRLLTRTSATPTKDKRKQRPIEQEEESAAEAEPAGESNKKPKLSRNCLRKLKKKLRAMEATGNVGAVQPLQSQITAMTATMAESEEDVIRRRLAAVEKLEKMLLEGAKLAPEQHSKIQRKAEFLERLHALTVPQ